MITITETHLLCINKREKIVHFFVGHSVAPQTIGMIVYLVTAVKLETFGTVVNKLFKMLKERLFKLCVAVKTSRRRKVRIVNIIVV